MPRTLYCTDGYKRTKSRSYHLAADRYPEREVKNDANACSLSGSVMYAC